MSKSFSASASVMSAFAGMFRPSASAQFARSLQSLELDSPGGPSPSRMASIAFPCAVSPAWSAVTAEGAPAMSDIMSVWAALGGSGGGWHPSTAAMATAPHAHVKREVEQTRVDRGGNILDQATSTVTTLIDGQSKGRSRTPPARSYFALFCSSSAVTASMRKGFSRRGSEVSAKKAFARGVKAPPVMKTKREARNGNAATAEA